MAAAPSAADRKSTRLNSSHEWISYAVFCLKKKKRAVKPCLGQGKNAVQLQLGRASRAALLGQPSVIFVPDSLAERSRRLFFFFFNDTATTEIYTLSLLDALPISAARAHRPRSTCPEPVDVGLERDDSEDRKSTRLNSSHEWISYAVFCLKKKKGSSGVSHSHRWRGRHQV